MLDTKFFEEKKVSHSFLQEIPLEIDRNTPGVQEQEEQVHIEQIKPQELLKIQIEVQEILREQLKKIEIRYAQWKRAPSSSRSGNGGSF